jgi:hypothetical protein
MQSEQTYDYDDMQDEDPQEQKTPNWRRKLERDAEEGRKAQAAAALAQKELAFYKAGLPMDDPRMAYFVKGYDGPADPDAIKKAATDAGFISAPPADTAVEDEVRQHQQIADASTGAGVAGKLTQADILALARKAGDAAPRGMEAQAFQAVLTEHGLNRMQRPPQG